MKRLDLNGLAFLAVLLALAVGCSSGDSSSGNDDANGSVDSNAGEATGTESASAAPLLLKAKPQGAKSLAAVKESASVGDEVAFEARIGGRSEPFVENRAVMVVIDPSLPSCADNGGACPIPWDYCCEAPATLVANTATVQWVDDEGRPRDGSLKGRGGLEELAWITVVGEVAMKDDSGVFVVNATGVFLDKKG